MTQNIVDKKLKGSYYPILRGKDIQRYTIVDPCLYVNYGRHLACPRSKEIFEQPKILIREAGEKITATYDDDNYYVMSSLYNAIAKNSVFDLKYLLALINSRLFQFLMWKIALEKTQGVFAKAKIFHYYNLPVKNIVKKDQQNFVRLVDRILTAKKEDHKADTSAWEREIDQLVYKLYGLTEEEIAVVEGRGAGGARTLLDGAAENDGARGAPGKTSAPGKTRAPGKARGRVPTASDDDEELE